MVVMKLYVHFGIYKAGSSYLQYILSNSRDFLAAHNIFFPSSRQDQRMQKGLISAGNADGLEIALKTKNQSECIRILNNWKQTANQKNCDRVLISAESLIHHLVISDRLHILQTAAQKVGFTEVHAMGFFRDLADHAISTYKHRGKSGKIPDFDKWLADFYETPMLLKNLFIQRNTAGSIVWTFRKFQKDSKFMQLAFFNWLGTPEPSFHGKSQVNESVSFSEVCLMNEVSKVYPYVTDYFVERIKSLPSSKKAKDVELENFYYNRAVEYLSKHQNTLKDLNKYLPETEKLFVGTSVAESAPSKNHLVFTHEQLQNFLLEIKFFRTKRGKMILMRRRIKSWLPKSIVRTLGMVPANRK